jgi:hypothetical protein
MRASQGCFLQRNGTARGSDACLCMARGSDACLWVRMFAEDFAEIAPFRNPSSAVHGMRVFDLGTQLLVCMVSAELLVHNYWFAWFPPNMMVRCFSKLLSLLLRYWFAYFSPSNRAKTGSFQKRDISS